MDLKEVHVEIRMLGGFGAALITGACCNDAACVPVCPVNCIHPAPGEPDYASAEMLYVDPVTCIDCGACADVCPVSAIVADFELAKDEQPFEELNAAWYAEPGRSDYPPDVTPIEPLISTRGGALRVAVIGSGPAAAYAVEALLESHGLEVEINVYERLLAPGGLVRYGVAPDHEGTKSIGDGFMRTFRRSGVRLHLGADVTPSDLADSHHAVLFAGGAAKPRVWDVPGADLEGVHSAAEFVAWYNGHPDADASSFDLLGTSAVVIGSGNVALDVARILAGGEDLVATTDIADKALDALKGSQIREVTVVARRGVEEAAFTAGELLRLSHAPGIRIRARPEDLDVEPTDPIAAFKVESLRKASEQDVVHDDSTGARINFRFGDAPVEVVGGHKAEGVRLSSGEVVAAGLILAAIGYEGGSAAGLPFDRAAGGVPNDRGRVKPGLYVAGWAKRAGRGGIGSNRTCARETVASVLADHDGGLLLEPSTEPPESEMDLEQWVGIDREERSRGRDQRRPRIKMSESEIRPKDNFVRNSLTSTPVDKFDTQSS